MTPASKAKAQPQDAGKTPKAPVPEHLQPSPVHAEDNPALVWIKQNWLFLTLFVLAFLVVGIIQIYRPSMVAESRRASWELYFEYLGTNQADALRAENLPATLATLREDERIYPFAVIRAASEALADGDAQALPIVEEALVGIQDNALVADLMLTVDGESMTEVAYLLGKVREELANPLAGLKFENAEPTGAKVALTIRIGSSDTYTLTVGLYEDVAPEACARFLAAVQAGALEHTKPEFAGAYQLRFHWMAPADAEVDTSPLPLESLHGYYHLEGALATVEGGAGSKVGEQQGDSFGLFVQDAPFFDGRSSVFGRLVGSESEFERLQAVKPSSTNPSAPTDAIEILSVEVL